MPNDYKTNGFLNGRGPKYNFCNGFVGFQHQLGHRRDRTVSPSSLRPARISLHASASRALRGHWTSLLWKSQEASRAQNMISFKIFCMRHLPQFVYFKEDAVFFYCHGGKRQDRMCARKEKSRIPPSAADCSISSVRRSVVFVLDERGTTFMLKSLYVLKSSFVGI